MAPTRKKPLLTASGSCQNVTPKAFQDLVQERKQEVKREAEEKRLRDLKRIGEMKSKSGVNPPDCFPKNVWTNVLEKLEPKDIANTCQVHDFFLDLMEDSRIRDVLFPLVMDHKIPLVKMFGDDRLEMMKNLRSVSKRLRDSVDNWIVEKLLSQMKNAECEWQGETFRLNVIGGCDEILSFFEGPVVQKPKRFFLRSLEISFDARGIKQLGIHQYYSTVFPVFKHHVTEMLGQVGDQILRFELTCSLVNELEKCGVSITQIYIVLREWLMLMPKLKWLSIKIDPWDTQSCTSHSRRMRNIDAGILQQQNMPKMESLERVDWISTPDDYNTLPICNAIFASNQHVKYHNCDLEQEVQDYITPSVRALALEAVVLGDAMEGVNIPLLREISSSSNWKLARMAVTVDAEDGAIDKVFRCLEKFPTLKDLSLNITNVIVGLEISFLKLPNLTALELEFGEEIEYGEHFNFFLSLQFLLYCSKLEKLSWINENADSGGIRRKMRIVGRKEGMIDFQGGLFDLTGSNLWDVFPRLLDIEVCFTECVGPKREWRMYHGKYQKGKLVYENKKLWD